MEAKGGFTNGPSHDDGGIPMTVKSTGQKIEVLKRKKKKKKKKKKEEEDEKKKKKKTN